METITLRDYQQECVNIINNTERGSYLVAVATGLGKTVIFSHICRSDIPHKASCKVDKSKGEAIIEKMKNNAIKWLYAVPKKKKPYILALMLVQALHGASGVLYALLLRNIVDNATAHDKAGFWHFVVLTVLLVVAQIGMRAVLRWLNELSRATFENIFKARLMHISSEKTSQA